ncbi:DNA-binding transcriptional regulator KdgR [Halarchaeum salinum]|uniref:DNA-binding transcriptional regulator KdgR n=1 Tax=Halarchaeum salinum TaxID=489912 RepID=A0AAV3S9K5_9EURY
MLRAFEVVEILEERQGARPSEVASALDVTRATAHDYLVSLAEVGYVTREDGYYDIGYRFLETGNRKKYRNWLFHASSHTLHELYEETGERVVLGIEEEGDWVLIHIESDRENVGLSPYSGRRTPLHTHAAGKVILAELPDDRRAKILEDGALAASTERSITDPAELRRELDQIVEDGYAVDWEEHDSDTGYAACPIVIDGMVRGSVAVVGPASRFRREEYREYLVGELRAAAETIRIERTHLLEHD